MQLHVLMASTIRVVPTIPGRLFRRLYTTPSNHNATIEALSRPSWPTIPGRLFRRLYTTPSNHNATIEALSKPSWSVHSLLPQKSHNTTSPEDAEITPEKLRHLLRLAALPPPATAEEESDLVKTLLDQLHFVKDVQSVDTSGVEPLRMIQDEVSVREYNVENVVSGGENPIGEQGSVKWDVLSLTGKRLGSYLVVDEAPEIEGKTLGNDSKSNM